MEFRGFKGKRVVSVPVLSEEWVGLSTGSKKRRLGHEFGWGTGLMGETRITLGRARSYICRGGGASRGTRTGDTDLNHRER